MEAKKKPKRKERISGHMAGLFCRGKSFSFVNLVLFRYSEATVFLLDLKGLIISF
jgi:hypothetical protein